MDWHYPRSIYSVSLMCAEASKHGLSIAQCLEQTGIGAEMLNNPAIEIMPAQEMAVLRNLQDKLSNQTGLGLNLGACFDISVYGVLAFTLSSCATLHELIELATRHSALTFALTDRHFVRRGQEFHFIFSDAHIPVELRPLVLERDIRGSLNVAAELFSTVLPIIRCELNYSRPDYAELYTERLGLMPVFDADQNALILDCDHLDMPLPQANRQALHYWESQLQELLEKKQTRSGTAEKVRRLLSRTPGQIPDMEAVAAEMRISSRQLRRQLNDEETSFRALVDELRETLAEELLTAGRLTVEQVAERLGFNEIASFTNAFKRWKGLPPSRWRNQQVPGRMMMVPS